MIKEFEARAPALHPTVRLAETAVVAGDVTAGPGVSLWYGAVVRGDTAPVRIGENTNLQDHVTVHTDAGHPVLVGKHVSVGHGTILHGCAIEDGALIGMGAILLNGCTIGAQSIVAAGALVPQGMTAPPRSLLLGSPARVVRTLREEELEGLEENCREYLRLAAQLPAVGEGSMP